MQIYVNTSANTKSRISIYECQIQNKTQERMKKKCFGSATYIEFLLLKDVCRTVQFKVLQLIEKLPWNSGCCCLERMCHLSLIRSVSLEYISQF